MKKEDREKAIKLMDQTGKVLVAEKNLIDDYIKNIKGIVDKNGVDKRKQTLAIISNSILTVIAHLKGRVENLEQLNQEEGKDK